MHSLYNKVLTRFTLFCSQFLSRFDSLLHYSSTRCILSCNKVLTRFTLFSQFYQCSDKIALFSNNNKFHKMHSLYNIVLTRCILPFAINFYNKIYSLLQSILSRLSLSILTRFSLSLFYNKFWQDLLSFTI